MQQSKQKPSHLSRDSFHSWNTHPRRAWPRWGSAEVPQFPLRLCKYRNDRHKEQQ